MSESAATGGLATRRCVPCRGGVPPLTRAAAAPYLAEIGSAWSLADDGTAITRSVTFGSFPRAMRFINALADLAEDEGHHPDFCGLVQARRPEREHPRYRWLVRERFHPGSEDQPIAERPPQAGVEAQAVDGVTACHRCCTAGLS